MGEEGVEFHGKNFSHGGSDNYIRRARKYRKELVNPEG